MARISKGEGWSALALDGQIDEHNRLSELDSLLSDASRLYVDLGAIRRINSIGVRDWVVWLTAARQRFAEVILTDCPPAIMHEVNLVKNFAAGARIATFRVPYYCEACGKESMSLLKSSDLLAQGIKEPPSDRCERVECRNDLDDDGTFYFAFLDEQAGMSPTAAPAGEAERVRDHLAQASQQPLSGESEDAHARHSRVVQPLKPEVTRGSVGTPQSVQSSSPPTAKPSGVDLVFVLALVAMLAVLGVLIYLIVTLE